VWGQGYYAAAGGYFSGITAVPFSIQATKRQCLSVALKVVIKLWFFLAVNGLVFGFTKTAGGNNAACFSIRGALTY